MNVDSNDLEEKPIFGVDLNTDFILGMAKSKDKVKTLLNINQVLSSGEISMITEKSEKSA